MTKTSKTSTTMKPGDVKHFDNGNFALRLDGSGYFTAVSPAASKDFKTEKGAMNWLTRRGLEESA